MALSCSHAVSSRAGPAQATANIPKGRESSTAGLKIHPAPPPPTFAILTFGVLRGARLVYHQAARHLFDNDAILIDIVVMS